MGSWDGERFEDPRLIVANVAEMVTPFDDGVLVPGFCVVGSGCPCGGVLSPRWLKCI